MSELARLLGRPAVTIDGVTTEVRRTKSGALWAFLAYGNRWVDRSELLFLLWPDTVHAQAQANLRQLLRTVGKAPWGRRLELDRRRVRLLVDSDVAEFAAAAGTRPKAALEAYGGRFLDGFHVDDAPEFEAWADIERLAGLARRLA
jgi:DNA-binding SARP family transcriptional activator